jgi:hypothetical protein
LPDNLPETPAHRQIGNLSGDREQPSSACEAITTEAQGDVSEVVTSTTIEVQVNDGPPADHSISCHEPQNSGNSPRSLRPPRSNEADQSPSESDPLTDLLHRALKATANRPGRPRALDDQAKGQLIALLSVGMSMRQAAAVLGVSHTTIQNMLKADPALGDDINAARFQAQLQPLACVIREARRSWKAATWLLKYLDAKIASHEETPDERRQRQQRETDEFISHATSRHVKQRKTLG